MQSLPIIIHHSVDCQLIFPELIKIYNFLTKLCNDKTSLSAPSGFLLPITYELDYNKCSPSMKEVGNALYDQREMSHVEFEKLHGRAYAK